MQGFKSFANKIKLDFHNGITGIVGPNGSGKSNIADAVRWVLGEQSAKQLRGESMQDVIFEGTENRKPLSYAYVKIVFDNSDHVLPIDYDEVSVARRVYRSGESEYLLNGSPVRLKDVNELFYDTGIGKEGYSIIGQGQIEKIISGRPEDRRELFDEAAGIVKFKKRKNETIKKLQEEEDNLLRVNDILSELEKQVGPLEKQADKAKDYLNKKERQKNLDINLFVIDKKTFDSEAESVQKDIDNANSELGTEKAANDSITEKYLNLENDIAAIDKELEELDIKKDENAGNRAKLNEQISILSERIKSSERSSKDLENRIKMNEEEKANKEKEKETLSKEKDECEKQLRIESERLSQVQEDYDSLEDAIKNLSNELEKKKAELVDLLKNRGEIHSASQKNETLSEQIRLRKVELQKRLLERKTKEESNEKEKSSLNERLAKAEENVKAFQERDNEFKAKRNDWAVKKADAEKHLLEANKKETRIKSNLDVMKAMAERYEGYGNAVRLVCEQKDEYPGIIGPVSDIISVEGKYETAIETALGGNIQNVVTEDEEIAKKMISYLKENRLGRVTFLPLTTVTPHGLNDTSVLRERGIIGLASEIVDYDSKFQKIVDFLLGRIIVADNVDSALAVQRKNHFSYNIVTLDGDFLRPGGSLSGGAYKNKGNLLSRKRSLDESERELEKVRDEIKEIEQRISDIEVAQALMADDFEANAKGLSDALVNRNSILIELQNAKKREDEDKASYSSIENEGQSLNDKLKEIEDEKAKSDSLLNDSISREAELNKEIEALQNELDEKTYIEGTSTRTLSEVQVDESSARQKLNFSNENLQRTEKELKKTEGILKELYDKSLAEEVDRQKMESDIDEIKETLKACESSDESILTDRTEKQKKREELNSQYKDFFAEKEEVTKKITNLEKELLRLDTKKERIDENRKSRIDYLWTEYELSPHEALEIPVDENADENELRKELADIKNAIRDMGSVNVNAIEEYKEVSERYEFLKKQHDDLVDAGDRLRGLIDELDKGMTERFTDGFKDIKEQFNKVFKELFGGGRGDIQLQDEDNILESGITIIAEPPGKKLQNMMQLSGGEKALTAIALLFAIQNLKPSPFCLLDEIEAALDDSNVDRYANYLHKLTKNTQFIIITHRRGTMNAADRLYGITMQEKGVSTLVSVNLIENQLTN